MGTAAALLLTASIGHAATLDVSITNEQTGSGLYLTPLLTVIHDGGFDAFDAGSAASAALEDLAEEGRVGMLQAEAGPDAATGVLISPGGFPGAPVIDPGESPSASIDVDPTTQRYFSFFSMVIPSNDSFIGNDNPFAYELFDAMGTFTGPLTISVFGGDIWDAGTEVNFENGSGENAAFAVNGGVDVGEDENGVVALAGNVDFLFGTDIPTGGSIGSVPGSRTLLATINVDLAPIPLPAGAPLLLVGLGALGLAKRWRKA
ncbi:MAG: spondin domain-containing protein [Pseudomonadota bacterium]